MSVVGAERPRKLRDLHVPGDPLILPNAWDADSARLVVDAGFEVIATSSAAVAGALGYGDGEQASVEEMFAAAGRSCAAVDVPLTVDVESGYGLAAGELVDRLFAIDVAGCNIEDTDQRAGGMRSPQEQAEYIAAMAQRAGDGLVINARIDSFLGCADEQAALADAVDRARRYLDAGAGCVYPIHVASPDVLARFTEAVSPAPVNATLFPGGPGLPATVKAGVARISLGAGLWRSMRGWLTATLAELSAGRAPY